MTGEIERKVEQAIQNLNRQGFLSSENSPERQSIKAIFGLETKQKGNYVSAAASDQK